MSNFRIDAHELKAIGTGTRSSRLAAFRAANGLDPNGIKLAEGGASKAPVRTVATPAATTTPAPKLAPKAPAPTAAQIEQTRQRARHDAVMRSPHAKGRRSIAAGLLGGAPDRSAADIIAALPTMPTDAEAVANARRNRVATVWERAIAANTGKSVAPASKPATTTGNKAWDNVIARMAPAHAA
ncbi:hypothetical protein [Novosphingobium mathurense]|uniref:Uncharacterized protein n=1 Tax=Novosphingobium mathurense TaxID=428990 RepID=A0A1U6GTR6_9SPHN|nr:hypothetical protein [Novosphingobium mathurense]SLJ86884.1 hypothetical protein SAMN06295987_101401 [Novosphingobium mathurense]